MQRWVAPRGRPQAQAGRGHEKTSLHATDPGDNVVPKSGSRIAAWPEPANVPVVAVVLILAALPVLVTPLPPLVDYVNHLGRTDVIALAGRDLTLAGPAPDLGAA